MFFIENRLHFFRPLTGKYREGVVECLRLLYLRMFSSLADYGHQLNRQQVLEVFTEALMRSPSLDDEGEPCGHSLKTDRDRASWVLTRLLEYGWLEQHMDEASMQSAYRFSCDGRRFTQPLVDSGRKRFRTTQRNTRNTKNALAAFLEHQDIHDLLDAWEFSERIISDFTDLITELDDRKRELIHRVEEQLLVQKASEAFFDYMDKRFQPDVAVRLSADSVERHRDDIAELVAAIKRLSKQDKANSERKLRELMPDQLDGLSGSLLYALLEGIDTRVRSAAEFMLPEVRKALQSYTKRADIIIRQLTYMASCRGANVESTCQQLAALPEAEQSGRLAKAAEMMSGVALGYVDPGSVRLRASRRRQSMILTGDDGPLPMDREARKQAFIHDALDQAFVVSSDELRGYLTQQLAQGREVSVADLPISNAKELLARAHAIEVSSLNERSSEFQLEIRFTGEQHAMPYFEAADHFVIRLREQEA